MKQFRSLQGGIFGGHKQLLLKPPGYLEYCWDALTQLMGHVGGPCDMKHSIKNYPNGGHLWTTSCVPGLGVRVLVTLIPFHPHGKFRMKVSAQLFCQWVNSATRRLIEIPTVCTFVKTQTVNILGLVVQEDLLQLLNSTVHSSKTVVVDNMKQRGVAVF